MLRILRKDFLKRDQDSRAVSLEHHSRHISRDAAAANDSTARGGQHASKATWDDRDSAAAACKSARPAPFGSQSPARDGPGDAAKLYANIFGKGHKKETPDKRSSSVACTAQQSHGTDAALQRKGSGLQGWPMPYKMPEPVGKQPSDECAPAAISCDSSPRALAEAVPLADIKLTPFPLQLPSTAFISAAQLAVLAPADQGVPGATPEFAPAVQQRRSSWCSRVPETVTPPSVPTAYAAAAHGSGPATSAQPPTTAMRSQPQGAVRRASGGSAHNSAVPETPDSQPACAMLAQGTNTSGIALPPEQVKGRGQLEEATARGAFGEALANTLAAEAFLARADGMPIGGGAAASAAELPPGRTPLVGDAAAVLATLATAQGTSADAPPAIVAASEAQAARPTPCVTHANAREHEYRAAGSLQHSAGDDRPSAGRRQRRRERQVDPAFVMDEDASAAPPTLRHGSVPAPEPARLPPGSTGHDPARPQVDPATATNHSVAGRTHNAAPPAVIRLPTGGQPLIAPQAVPDPIVAAHPSAPAAAAAARRVAEQRALDAELRDAEDDMDVERVVPLPEPPAATVLAPQLTPAAASRRGSDTGLLTPERSSSRSGNGAAEVLRTPSVNGEGAAPDAGHAASLGSLTRRLEAFMQPAVARVLRSKCALFTRIARIPLCYAAGA